MNKDLEICKDLFFRQRWIVINKVTFEWVDSFDTEEEAKAAYPDVPRGPDIDYIE